jgi:hypothetical protein
VEESLHIPGGIRIVFSKGIYSLQVSRRAVSGVGLTNILVGGGGAKEGKIPSVGVWEGVFQVPQKTPILPVRLPNWESGLARYAVQRFRLPSLSA